MEELRGQVMNYSTILSAAAGTGTARTLAGAFGYLNVSCFGEVGHVILSQVLHQFEIIN